MCMHNAVVLASPRKKVHSCDNSNRCLEDTPKRPHGEFDETVRRTAFSSFGSRGVLPPKEVIVRRQELSPLEQILNIISCTKRAGPIPAIAIAVASLTGTAGFAQELIDPRNGQLQLEVTDLVIAAGPLTLDVTRTFRSESAVPGALGRGWQLNWESSLDGSNDGNAIPEGGSGLFRINGPHGSFLSLTADEHGRITRIESSMSSRVEYGYVGDRLVEARVNGGPPE